MYTGVTDSGLLCIIGLNDIDNEGTFVWTDGSSSNYIPWETAQPDDNGGIEDCVESRSIGVWNDIPCFPDLSCYFCSTKGKIIIMNAILISAVNDFQSCSAIFYKFDKIIFRLPSTSLRSQRGDDLLL